MFWQNIFLSLFGIIALVGFFWSFYQCRYRKNPFGRTYFFFPFGSFVFADLVVLAPFWIVVTLFIFFLQDFLLFLFIYALFWLIRSVGEAQYWFLQQFSTLNKNPIERFRLRKVFHNDSIWFVYQIYWQCLTVISLIASVYLGVLWVKTLL